MTESASARELRNRFRDAERNASHLRLLESACLALAEESSTAAAFNTVLAQALRFLTADGAVLLLHEAGTLTVQAAQGPVLPVGARIPAAGVLSAALRVTAQVAVRENVDSRLRVGHSQPLALEVLVPLRYKNAVSGVLALLSIRAIPPPATDDLRVLQALAVLLGAALASRGGAQPRAPNRDAAAQLAQLTPREQHILALLPRGLSNAEMAGLLGIATGTVKVHVERILHKLDLTDRTQAAVRAAEWGYRA